MSEINKFLPGGGMKLKCDPDAQLNHNGDNEDDDDDIEVVAEFAEAHSVTQNLQEKLRVLEEQFRTKGQRHLINQALSKCNELEQRLNGMQTKLDEQTQIAKLMTGQTELYGRRAFAPLLCPRIPAPAPRAGPRRPPTVHRNQQLFPCKFCVRSLKMVFDDARELAQHYLTQHPLPNSLDLKAIFRLKRRKIKHKKKRHHHHHDRKHKHRASNHSVSTVKMERQRGKVSSARSFVPTVVLPRLLVKSEPPTN